MVTFDARIKRKKGLEFIEELRDYIHVIDVTHLYSTPDLYHSQHADPQSSLTLNYTYLLSCTQMLAVISNLAPLYTRGAAGDSILRAGSEVEMLANAIAAKLQSKAESVRVISATGETSCQSRFVTLPQEAVPPETTHATASQG